MSRLWAVYIHKSQNSFRTVNVASSHPPDFLTELPISCFFCATPLSLSKMLSCLHAYCNSVPAPFLLFYFFSKSFLESGKMAKLAFSQKKCLSQFWNQCWKERVAHSGITNCIVCKHPLGSFLKPLASRSSFHPQSHPVSPTLATGMLEISLPPATELNPNLKACSFCDLSDSQQVCCGLNGLSVLLAYS